MAEWSNAAVLKTVDLHGSGGSNPSLSAQSSRDTALLFLLIRPAKFAGFFVFDNHSCKYIYKGVSSNTNNTSVVVSIKTEKSIRTLCRGLPPRLITSR